MSPLHDPVDLIQRCLDEWEDIPPVEMDIFATADASVIANRIADFCETHLGSRPVGYLFCSSSVGSSHGVRLGDGRKVVIKARPPVSANPDMIHDQESLSVICRAMTWLHVRGFPCPAILLGPTRIGRGLATVEEFLDRGRHGDAFQESDRRIMAAGLAELIRLLQTFDGNVRRVRLFPPDGALYPQPHSKLFDLEKTAAGAEWIDDFARRARQGEDPGGIRVLGHADWRVEHIRFENGRMVAVYDWDSLVCLPEAQIVGGAAAGFTADWSRPDVRRVPAGSDIRAFIADYEQARDRTFTERERKSVFAGCVYGLAYGARCAHSAAPGTAEWEEDSWPHLLRAEGESLLAEAGE